MQIISEKLQAHYECACGHFNKDQILGVFLYGSQNYNTDLPTSDVDTKAIYIPTLQELAFDKPVSVELELPNGEHCEVKDIREMIKNFKKQNINFVEILFTDFAIINPKYYQLWDYYFLNNRNEIARYDVHAAVHSMSHQASHTLKQNPEDGKKLSNALRLLYFLEGYICGRDYINCLRSYNNRATLLRELKSGEYKGSLTLLSRMLEIAFEDFKTADLHHLTDKTKQAKLDQLMQEGCLELIKLIF